MMNREINRYKKRLMRNMPVARHRSRRQAGLMFALGAGLGAAAGVAAGILTAPKSGKATRKDLARQGKKAVNDIKNTGQQIATDTAEDAKIMADAAMTTNVAKNIKKATTKKKPAKKTAKKSTKK